MGDSSNIAPQAMIDGHPGQEVIVLSDSSPDDDELSPSINGGTSSGNSLNSSDSDTNSDITVKQRNENGGDILVEVAQLIDWINFYEANQEKNASGSRSSVKQMFRDGFNFIEGLQTRFEDNANVIAEKNELIAEVVGENENLKSQLQTQQAELDKLRKRNAKLEKDRKEKKEEPMSFRRIRTKVSKLQGFFRTLICKLEQEPVNPIDPNSVQQRKEIDIFKREVGQLFHKVVHKLKKWETDQKDMEGELESTKVVLDKLNDMIVVKEKFRLTKNAVTTALHSSSEIAPAAPALPVQIAHSTIQRKRKLPPPALLPLPVPQNPTTAISSRTEILPQSPDAENIPFTPNIQRGKMSHQKHQHKVIDSLVTSLTALQTVPPKATTSTATRVNVQFHQSSNSSSSSFHGELPPMPQLNFALSNQLPLEACSQSDINPMTKLHPIQSHLTSSKEGKPATITKLPSTQQMSNTIMPLTSTWPLASSSVSSQPPPSNQFPMRKANSFPPHSENIIRSARLNCRDGGTSPIPATKHSLPPLRLLTSSKEVPVPEVHQREAIEIFGGPANSIPMPKAKPPKGLNVCGLCGMSFKSLVQLKLHHSVMHSKGPMPGIGTNALASVQPAPLKPLKFPSRQNATMSEREAPLPLVPATVETREPVHQKRLRLGPSPSFSANTSFPSGSRSSTETSSENSLLAPPQFGRMLSTDINNIVTNSNSNFTSNENSVYPFNFQ